MIYLKNGKLMETIPTEYKGIKFRSRAEARWAVFFDALGIKWLYEYEGYQLPSGWYVPDFYLPELEVWIEVKGARPTDIEDKLAGELAFARNERVFITWGVMDNDDWNTDSMTLHQPHTEEEIAEGWGKYGWDNMYRFCQCPICGKIGIEFEGRADRICEHCDGFQIEKQTEKVENAFETARKHRFWAPRGENDV